MLGHEPPAIGTFQKVQEILLAKIIPSSLSESSSMHVSPFRCQKHISFGSCQGKDIFNDIVGVVPLVKFCIFFPGFVGGCNVCQDSSLVYTNLLPRSVTVACSLSMSRKPPELLEPVSCFPSCLNLVNTTCRRWKSF